MRIFDKEKALFCQIQISMPDADNKVNFKRIQLSSYDDSVTFQDKAFYQRKENFIVFIFSVPNNDEDLWTFTQTYLNTFDSLFSASRRVNVFVQGNEKHFYVGFHGLNKTHHTVTAFLKAYDNFREANLQAFAKLDTFNNHLIDKMGLQVPPNAIRYNTLKNAGEVITVEKNGGDVYNYYPVTIADNSKQYIYKPIHDLLAGTKWAKIESFASLEMRFFSGNRGPIVIPVYNDEHAVIGVLSEKIENFETVHQYLSKYKKKADDNNDPKLFFNALKNFLIAYHDDITAISTACYAIPDDDLHLNQWGFEGQRNGHQRSLVKLDTAEIQPHTAKYRYLNKYEVRKHKDRELPPAVESFPVTQRDIDNFPAVQDTHFFNWIDDRATKDLNLIVSSKAAGLKFNERHFHFLLMMLFPKQCIERFAANTFTSNKDIQFYTNHSAQRFAEIGKACLRNRSFIKYLIEDHLLNKVKRFIFEFNAGLKNTYYDACQIQDNEVMMMENHFQFILSGLITTDAIIDIDEYLTSVNITLNKEFTIANEYVLPFANVPLFPVADRNNLAAVVDATLTWIHTVNKRFVEHNAFNETTIKECSEMMKTLKYVITSLKNHIHEGWLKEFYNTDSMIMNKIVDTEKLIENQTQALEDKNYCLDIYKHLTHTKWPLVGGNGHRIFNLFKKRGDTCIQTNGGKTKLELSDGQFQQYQIIARAIQGDMTFSQARQHVHQIGVVNKKRNTDLLCLSGWLRTAPVKAYFNLFAEPADSENTNNAVQCKNGQHLK